MQKNETPQNTSSEKSIPCTCSADPFASLPPELRPRERDKMAGLRKVTCPGCNLVYWTNRKTDLCINCESKGIKLPDSEVKDIE